MCLAVAGLSRRAVRVCGAWPGGRDSEVDVVSLKDGGGPHIRLVGGAFAGGAEAFEGGVFVAEGGEESVRKLGRIEGRLGELADGFFDFDGVHAAPESGGDLGG